MDPATAYIISGVATTSVTALVGLVAWIGRTIARGNWVPRQTYEDALVTIEKQHKRIEVQDERADGVILEVGRTLDAILQAVQTQTRDLP